MEEVSRFRDITVEQTCRMIDLLDPCTNDYLYVYDFVNDFYYISAHALQRFCMQSNSFYDAERTLAESIWHEDRRQLGAEIEELKNGSRAFHNLVYRWMSVEGVPIWINCRGYVVRREGAGFMVGSISEMEHHPMADNVSGLLGESSLRVRLMNAGEKLPDGYLLRIGLDNFKGINEKLGSDYGDIVLRRTAECILTCIHPGQILYRMMADEFMVLDLQGRTRENAQELYNNLRRAIDQFVAENHYEAFVTVSGGVLECSALSENSWSDIMKYSEFALNEAKRLGKNRCYVFNPDDYATFMRRKRLTQTIRQAVNHDFEGFEAYFQPVFHVNGQMFGAETLMRFHAEPFGNVSPGEFIPILEETGLIIPAGRWILHRALEFCHRMRMVLPDFRISVNLSHEQVRKCDLVAEVEAAVKEYDVPYSAIILELTESGLLDSDNYFIRLWENFKEKGILLALDDFGTGYSNFHYLNELKPDIIKINRAFTAKASDNEHEYNLLSLLTNMVHSLQLKLCVEGIETEQELEKMWRLPPDFSQGFYFGRPCAKEQFMNQFAH